MRGLYICGDVHGKLNELVYNQLKNKLGIKNSDIIIAGDFGVGFGGPNSMQVAYDKIKKYLDEQDIFLYVVRGNHDDPSWFDDDHNLERIKFLRDYVPVEINGKMILPVGGATSLDLDRKDSRTNLSRRDENNRFIRFGSRKRCWWEGEVVSEPPQELPIKVDIIVSHEAPLGFDPVAIRPSDVTFETWERAMNDRKILDKVQYDVLSKWWFYGHYHQHYSGHVGDLMYRCLKELELFEIRTEE